MKNIKTGTVGNVAKINEPYANEIKYSLNDILYLYSRQDYVDKLFKFLRNLKHSQESEGLSVKDFFIKHKIDWKISRTLKGLEIVDESFKWNAGEPSKKMAIDLALHRWRDNQIITKEKKSSKEDL